jgi:hypothetical protein
MRAESLGTVTFNLSHIENFKVSAQFWVVENIHFLGVCSTGSGCEHAFHIVGDADDFIFRNNEIENFASHVKLNGEFVSAEPLKKFPDRAWFIGNFWHNTRYMTNEAPHNILNLDGGRDHVVRGNIFADYAAPDTLLRSASAVYPKASALGVLVEQNLIVCEKSRRVGETARGIELGDGAGASICDGDTDGDGLGDCVENGQNQEAVVRNNIIMNCDNGGSSAGVMVGSDRDSVILHNTVFNTGARHAGFYLGHPEHDTHWRHNILENGINTNYANRALSETDNLIATGAELGARWAGPEWADLSLTDGAGIVDQAPTDVWAPHDFCGYPRGDTADRGAIEYGTADDGQPCVELVAAMFERIP